MKKVFIITVFLLYCFKANAQLVIDPALIAALYTTHKEQQTVLKDVQQKEGDIQKYQAIISLKMKELKDLEDKSLKYLSTVQGIVKSIGDIKYAKEIVEDIFMYQKKSAEIAKGDPKLLLIVTKTEALLVSRSTSVASLIYTFVVQNGEDNLLDNKQRIDIITKVVDELRVIRGLSYSVYRQLKYAKSGSFLEHFVPGQYRYVKDTKKIINEILKDTKL